MLVAAFLVSAAHAQSPKQLWVLQEPDQIVEYDIITFAARRTLTVPRRLLEHPEYLSINATGQMLFLPPNGAQWGGGEMAAAGDRAWFWDGHHAKEWKLEGPKTPGGNAACSRMRPSSSGSCRLLVCRSSPGRSIRGPCEAPAPLIADSRSA
ncbi:MAG TPA: hypothetical protein VF579_00280, partial [Candidatus Methylomirabilis sp.]